MQLFAQLKTVVRKLKIKFKTILLINLTLLCGNGISGKSWGSSQEDQTKVFMHGNLRKYISFVCDTIAKMDLYFSSKIIL